MFVWGGDSTGWESGDGMWGIECRGGRWPVPPYAGVGYGWVRAGSPSESPIARLNRAEFKRLKVRVQFTLQLLWIYLLDLCFALINEHADCFAHQFQCL